MNKILLLIVLMILACATSVSAQEDSSPADLPEGTLDYSRDGFWYMPAFPGQGLTLQATPGVPGSSAIGVANRVFGVFNTFKFCMPIMGSWGCGTQRWFYLDTVRCGVQPYPSLASCFTTYPASNQSITLDVYEFTKGRTNIANPTWLNDFKKPGKLTITFHSCTSATARFSNLVADYGGSFPLYDHPFALARLTPHPDCVAPGAAPPVAVANALGRAFEGNWANPLTPPQGFVLQPILGTDRVIGAWETFDPSQYNFNPRWFYFSGTSTSDRSAELDIYNAGGGPIHPSSPVWFNRAGRATLQFESCARGTISAHFFAGPTNYEIPVVNFSPNPTCRAELLAPAAP